ncbi:MAG: phosphate ABC transporter ATP-binding protein [Syntrophomonas sp.]|uniref:ABC transporter ATP-binding protein n=1 Tax=Syntrophomonas sp. TaxID=2053627 RepID=UPI0026365D3F|nr:phosphate ABC transporter ATP-binding protein [Syntrophomonas sp.]MDD2510183.1 phosphate ABC transporter ATP-binding protein [Syntrophomonas sp.]MDD3879165.1 phosphate ABC transporter ATP-binding protein [Syntrophomonas sp.]MDD4625790.1 phosphate ABC transporter ATP-binding protein [Syntrophomonas sp.]
MNLFEISGLRKSFGSRTVLNIDELTLQAGKIYAVLGPNGSGKTTLLRILNLLAAPDTGRIKFMGGDIGISQADRLSVSRQMCMVFQRPFMFRSTVFNNVAYGLKLRRVAKADCEKRVNEALDFVGMGNFVKQSATRLSGGETQRVALARALVLQPQVLLLDEPTANLDPGSVQQIEEIIRKYHQEYNTSVIIVTHNLFQAKRMADETILLINGEVLERASTAEFFEHPRELGTRHFLDGTMVY